MTDKKEKNGPGEGAQDPDPATEEKATPVPVDTADVLQALTRTFERFTQSLQDFAMDFAKRAIEAPAEVLAAPDLSVYRTITATVGVQELNKMLAQGWDLISAEYCEEVRKRSGVGRQQSVIAWTLYATIGRREALAETDRQALAATEERRAWEAGVPVDDQPGGDQPEGAAPEGEQLEGQRPIGMATRGRQVTARADQQGFEPTGGLANR